MGANEGSKLMKAITRYIRHSMTILLVLIIAYATPAYNQSHKQSKGKKPDQPAYTGFVLAAQAEKDVIGAGEPLNLRLNIKNISNTVRFIIQTSATEQYRLTVLDERGGPVRLTQYGENELQPRKDHLGQAVKTMKPGEESRDTIQVSKLYDMSSPGTYSITARRIVYKDAKETGSVESNTVTIKVTR